MKFTTVKTEKKCTRLKGWEAEAFFQRIRTDANHSLITNFRQEASVEHPEGFRRYNEIPHVYAAVELHKQANGALGIAAFNGLVVLEIRQLMSQTLCAEVKDAAMTMPSTLAAFTGATGTEVIILVSVARADGTLPYSEPEAEGFYTNAYHSVAHIYDAVLPIKITRMTPSLRHEFLLPLDKMPLTNFDAVPIRITPSKDVASDEDDADAHLLATPVQMNVVEEDMTAYENSSVSMAMLQSK